MISICINFFKQVKLIWPTNLEVRVVITSGQPWTWNGTEVPWDAVKVSYLDLGGGYIGVYIYKNELSYEFKMCALYCS